MQGKYVLIEEYSDDNHLRVLTRYKGKYIAFIVTKDFSTIITALEYNKNMFDSIELYVKEFD